MDAGDAAWVLTSAALVLFMTPGLALFYGGMDRQRNVLNMLMMNFWCLLAVPVVGALLTGVFATKAVNPNGADGLLAGNAALLGVQALAVGHTAFSFQFHVEVMPTTVDDWSAIPAYRESLERVLGADGADAFRARSAACMPAFNALARRLYDNWRATAFSAAAFSIFIAVARSAMSHVSGTRDRQPPLSGRDKIE